MNLPKVAVLSLGGKISWTDAGSSGIEPTLGGEDLVSSVPEIAEAAEVEAASLRQTSSGNLTPDDLMELAEEVAFALDLLVDRESPVVVTGAMRNPTLSDADGHNCFRPHSSLGDRSPISRVPNVRGESS